MIQIHINKRHRTKMEVLTAPRLNRRWPSSALQDLPTALPNPDMNGPFLLAAFQSEGKESALCSSIVARHCIGTVQYHNKTVLAWRVSWHDEGLQLIKCKAQSGGGSWWWWWWCPNLIKYRIGASIEVAPSIMVLERRGCAYHVITLSRGLGLVSLHWLESFRLKEP